MISRTFRQLPCYDFTDHLSLVAVARLLARLGVQTLVGDGRCARPNIFCGVLIRDYQVRLHVGRLQPTIRTGLAEIGLPVTGLRLVVPAIVARVAQVARG